MSNDAAKRAAAARALELVETGMKLGLGTGSGRRSATKARISSTSAAVSTPSTRCSYISRSMTPSENRRCSNFAARSRVSASSTRSVTRAS